MWKNRLKSKSFWISVISAIVLLVQTIFDLKIDNTVIASISNGVLGILVFIGIVNDNATATIAENTDIVVEDTDEREGVTESDSASIAGLAEIDDTKQMKE